ncbi:MAG TPA: glycosyltransferase family 39 protein, partial [Bryobacteraceae bacterium]|nr:glycosyltransferase family 39 protein [Bryobacteraceae bacterium]
MILASILLGWLACGITCLAAGLAAVRAFRLDLNRAEALCLGFALGAALTSTLSLALAFLFAARAGVFLGLAALAAALLWRQLPWLRSLKPADWRSIPAAFRYLVAVVWAAYGGLYLLHAMEPAIAPDTYHLGFVNQWNLAHGMTRIVDCYAALPQGLEMLYLFAFSIGRDSGAVLVHYLFLMALPAAMLLYGVRFGIGRGGAAFAAIVVFVTPTVGWDGSIAYNDVALALAVLTTLYLFQIWRSGRSAGVLAAAGLMAGYCIAIKYTGALALIPLFAAALWDLRRDLRAAARAFLILTAAAAAFPAPYLVRNWLWYGNPIAFFGNAIFP